MSEALIVRHCSPTLAGLKTASLFSCEYDDSAELMAGIRRINEKLGGKGVRMMPLRLSGGRALIYLFRPSRLENDLKDPVSAEILASCGYGAGKAARLISMLRSRLVGQDFPHEIGLFLGYPPEDVRCFMCEKNRECKCVGCWRAYSNEAEAQRIFARFKKCTDVYCRKLKEGSTLEKLTVAA